MPYCEIITTAKIDKQLDMKLSHELARIIELVPGKQERWVMTHIEDEARMSLGGINTENSAMVTLSTFGELTSEQYNMLTKELCASASKLLNVAPDRIYVRYESIIHWGWNGENF